MLRYQKEPGITLFRARSLANHCTKKRMKKHDCATRPMASHPAPLATVCAVSVRQGNAEEEDGRSGNRQEDGRAGRHHFAAPAVDEDYVSKVDEDAGSLADGEDRLAPVDGVDKERRASAEGEKPEGRRHDALSLPLAGGPLDEEPQEERRLRREAEEEPPELSGVNVVRQPLHAYPSLRTR